jgi:hypothetical protein
MLQALGIEYDDLNRMETVMYVVGHVKPRRYI